jgi:hypothetical protein
VQKIAEAQPTKDKLILNFRTYNPKQGLSKQVESNIPGGPWASRPTVR